MAEKAEKKATATKAAPKKDAGKTAEATRPGVLKVHHLRPVPGAHGDHVAAFTAVVIEIIQQVGSVLKAPGPQGLLGALLPGQAKAGRGGRPRHRGTRTAVCFSAIRSG